MPTLRIWWWNVLLEQWKNTGENTLTPRWSLARGHETFRCRVIYFYSGLNRKFFPIISLLSVDFLSVPICYFSKRCADLFSLRPLSRYDLDWIEPGIELATSAFRKKNVGNTQHKTQKTRHLQRWCWFNMAKQAGWDLDYALAFSLHHNFIT